MTAHYYQSETQNIINYDEKQNQNYRINYSVQSAILKNEFLNFKHNILSNNTIQLEDIENFYNKNKRYYTLDMYDLTFDAIIEKIAQSTTLSDITETFNLLTNIEKNTLETFHTDPLITNKVMEMSFIISLSFWVYC